MEDLNVRYKKEMEDLHENLRQSEQQHLERETGFKAEIDLMKSTWMNRGQVNEIQELAASLRQQLYDKDQEIAYLQAASNGDPSLQPEEQDDVSLNSQLLSQDDSQDERFGAQSSSACKPRTNALNITQRFERLVCFSSIT